MLNPLSSRKDRLNQIVISRPTCHPEGRRGLKDLVKHHTNPKRIPTHIVVAGLDPPAKNHISA